MGSPKSQLRDSGGVPYLDLALTALLEGGCVRVCVVLGAEAETAVGLLDALGWAADERVEVVVATDWEEGMGASLRHGLTLLSAAPPSVECAMVTLVDLPDVGPSVVERVLSVADGPSTIARAAYVGEAGHPVLLGRDHWMGVGGAAQGDRGARDYLAAGAVRLVECGDLATGRDVDVPADLRPPD